jgi:hypothetical protein
MLYSTLRLFAIAFEQPFILLLKKEEYPCLEFFCHHRGDNKYYTARALDVM